MVLKQIANGEIEGKQIEPGALYHCEDTHNTYLGTGTNSVEIYSTASGRTIFGNPQTGEIFNDYN